MGGRDCLLLWVAAAAVAELRQLHWGAEGMSPRPPVLGATSIAPMPRTPTVAEIPGLQPAGAEAGTEAQRGVVEGHVVAGGAAVLYQVPHGGHHLRSTAGRTRMPMSGGHARHRGPNGGAGASNNSNIKTISSNSRG